MEEPKNKYILLSNRVGFTTERNLLARGLSTKSTPTNVLRGELLEALSEAKQPQDSSRIALIGIDRKSLRIECSKEDLARLADEDANLLLAISSSELRYQTLIDRTRLDFGRRLLPDTQVFVSVKGIPKAVHGIVWYKGELPSLPGTTFGVELIRNPGQGTCDGTFRNKRYFNCGEDSGVFVGLDKLTPKEHLDCPPDKKRCDNVLEIDQRDERVGSGTGKRNGRQLFACKRDFAGFVALETIIPEKDFDENPKESTGKKTSEKEDPILEQIRKDESLARSMSYDNGTSGAESVRKVRKTSLVDSADAKLIVAAGESSQTDPSAFIEKQRQMLNEMKGSKAPGYRDDDDNDVVMQDEDRRSNAVNF